MKRFLSIIISLVVFAAVANAQISINRSEVDKAKQVATLSMAWSWIYQDSDGYYLVMKSDNQFDDSYWLHIGKTKDECLESLASLGELFDMGETERFDIDNGIGESYDVTLGRELGIKKLIFHGEGYAGSGFLLASNISKAEKWIEKNVK